MINHYLPHPVCGAYTMCARTPAEKAKALAEIAKCDACAGLKSMTVRAWIGWNSKPD